MNDLNTLIANAVEEQSAVSDDINLNVVKISSDAENLAGESHELLNMIRRFSQ